MTHSFESNPFPNDDSLLNDLDFNPDTLTLDEQQLALIDLQHTFATEWANDPNGFMVRIIDRLLSDIDTANRLTHLYVGARHTDSALGVHTESVVIHAHSKRIIVPPLSPGSSPRVQRIDKDIPITSTTEGDRKVARYFQDTDATLVASQIDRLRQLQTLCPNLSEDLMTIVPTPGKELTRLWRSDASLSSRSQD